MYIPSYFKIQNPAIALEFIRSHSFGMLISCSESGPEITHIPFIIKDPENSSETELELLFHVAGANPHPSAGRAMAVFQGPHAYISPSWYEQSNSVPTWNYIAIHASGVLEPVEDSNSMQEIMDATVSKYELDPSAWSIDWENPYMEKMLSGVRCFRLKVDLLEGKAKLSQNHSEERRRRVIKQLQKGNEMDREVARLMEIELEAQK